MPKATNLPALDLRRTKDPAQLSPSLVQGTARSVESPQSLRFPPRSPLSARPVVPDSDGLIPVSPRLDNHPEPPASPGRLSPKLHSRDTSRNFFTNLMASKSSNRLHSPETSIAEHPERPQTKGRSASRDHSLRKQASTPDLPRLMTPTPNYEEEVSNGGKSKGRSKLGGLLGRSRPGRPEEEKKKGKPPTSLLDGPEPPPSSGSDQLPVSAKTGPVKVNGSNQQLNVESTSTRERSIERGRPEEQKRAPSTEPSSSLPREQSILSNISHTGRGVGNRIGHAGTRLLNKMTRSGSTNEKEGLPAVLDEHYACTTITLPLIQQTRRTRIAKQLETSKDKTEYWMPALPWRCIDYLNMQCETEGLYRVPGSGKDVKFWQRRFDTEYDINLFNEPELYDVNTIASMFKAWLRDLPDELLPKSAQQRISQLCPGNSRPSETPQILKDELSKLPPFNYYLLFAITCHLSLLHNYADINKMDYRNLCICFQPCLKIDAFCFQYLVINWKECWQQGCWTEKQYLEEERRHEREEGSLEAKPDTSSSGSSANQTTIQPQAVMSNPSSHGHTKKSLDSGMTRPSMPQNSSHSGQKSHSISDKDSTQSGSQPPRVGPPVATQTFEHERNGSKLPELGNMSPIQM